MRRDDSAYQSWLWGEILLFGLLAAGLALFAAYPDLRPTYELPQARLVLDTMVALAAALVAGLAGVRLSGDGRRLDLLLGAGFSAAAGARLVFRRDPARLRRTALRLHAARLQPLHHAGRLPAPPLVRGAARRRLAGDPPRRVRAGRRRGARTRGTGDPRRPRAIPVRGIDTCDEP